MASINIKSKVQGLTPNDCLKLAEQLIQHRQPKQGSFDYGLITFGVIDITFIGGCLLTKPIHVRQDGKRKSEKSPINIVIEYHQSLF